MCNLLKWVSAAQRQRGRHISAWHIINATFISMVQDLFHAAETVTSGVICTEKRGNACLACAF